VSNRLPAQTILKICFHVTIAALANYLLMVNCREVDPYVAPLRDRYDPSAARGLGAHITLLHASLPAGGLDAGMIVRFSGVVGTAAAFPYRIGGVARFPGTLYLAVEPAAPFAALHEQLKSAAQLTQPGGRSPPFVPHISIVRKGTGDDAPVEAELTAMLGRHGPIACHCSEVELLENSAGRWRSVQHFALTGHRDTP
jgi:2'-5' RNA ligase